MRILVIEDHFGIRLALKMLLELEGHEVTVADRGEEALTLLQESPMDLVLLDLTTNGISAYEFKQRLKDSSEASGRPMPLLGILSGSSQIEVESRQLGADFHIRKPFDQNDLLVRIQAVASRPGLRAERVTAPVPKPRADSPQALA